MNLEPGHRSGPPVGTSGSIAGVEARPTRCQRRFSSAKPKGSAMSGTARKIIYVMLVIVVLLIIWQFLGSL
jgi:hypothetical protein